MSSSSQPDNLSCDRCHTAQSDLDTPLQRCSACHSVRYCGRECQRKDWPDHKAQCRHIRNSVQLGADAAEPARSRTTTRVNLGDFMNSTRNDSAPGASSSSGCIYHLITSDPHIWDVSSSGPFATVEAAAAQAVRNFGQECPTGITQINEFQAQSALSSIEHIRAPVNGDANRIRTIRFVKERNVAMAARLPGPAWRVLSSEVADFVVEALRSGREMTPGPHGGMPVKDMDVHGTYASAADANAAARSLAQRRSTIQPHGNHGLIVVLRSLQVWQPSLRARGSPICRAARFMKA